VTRKFGADARLEMPNFDDQLETSVNGCGGTKPVHRAHWHCRVLAEPELLANEGTEALADFSMRGTGALRPVCGLI